MAGESNWLFLCFISNNNCTTFIQIVCSCGRLLEITSQLNLSEAYFNPADPKPKAALIAGAVGDLALESPVALRWRAGGMIHICTVFSNKQQANPLPDSTPASWTSSCGFSFICGRSQDFSKEDAELAHASLF